MHTMKDYASVAVYGIISLHFADRRLTAATQYGLRRCRDLGTPRGYLGALLVLNLSLDVVNGVRRLDVERDCFARDRLREDLHPAPQALRRDECW